MPRKGRGIPLRPSAPALRAGGRALFFDHLVAEHDAFRIVLLEPLISKLWRREYLEVVDVANLLAGVDVNPNGCHWSLLSFRFPQCVSLRDESNSRSMFRFKALMIPMRAIMAGPFFSATRIRHSIAACHSPRFCSALGSFMM